MTTLQQLSNDMIILILQQLNWRDLYNFWKSQPIICQDPRVQTFIETRIKEITHTIIHELLTTETPKYLNSLNSQKTYQITKILEYSSIYHLHPHLFTTGPIYEFWEEYTGDITSSTLHIQSIRDSLESVISCNGHIITNIYVKNQTDLEKIIKHLLINGQIDV